jgi:hypothetical protein
LNRFKRLLSRRGLRKVWWLMAPYCISFEVTRWRDTYPWLRWSCCWQKGSSKDVVDWQCSGGRYSPLCFSDTWKTACLFCLAVSESYVRNPRNPFTCRPSWQFEAQTIDTNVREKRSVFGLWTSQFSEQIDSFIT